MEQHPADARQSPKRKRRFGRREAKTRAAGLALPGLDLRSVEGRHYSKIALALVAEFPEADPAQIRELAALRLSGEQAQADALLGRDIYARSRARDDAVRISNLICRRETELRARLATRAPPKAPSLREILAEHNRTGAT